MVPNSAGFRPSSSAVDPEWSSPHSVSGSSAISAILASSSCCTLRQNSYETIMGCDRHASAVFIILLTRIAFALRRSWTKSVLGCAATVSLTPGSLCLSATIPQYIGPVSTCTCIIYYIYYIYLCDQDVHASRNLGT